MGGSKKSGRGGGGGGYGGRNCNPEDRKKLSKDPGVPGNDLRRAGEALNKTRSGSQRRVLNIPTLFRKAQQPSQQHADPNSSGDLTEAEKTSQMAAFALHCAKRQAEHQAPNLLLGDSAEGLMNEEDYQRKGKDVSLRRFFKEFQKVVESSDVLLEVIDVRDPLGCRLERMEKSISSQWGDKKSIVVVLNKIDLVHPDVVEQWVKWFEEDQQMLVIPFSANKDSAQRTGCIPRLFKMLRSLARGEGGARKSITVGLIGYPNVGKSSVINSLKRKNVVGVGNTPGFTTGNTEVDLRQDVKIMDCPGVVMPGEDTGDVVLRNAVKVDQLPNPLVAVERLIQRCDPDQLSAVYEVGTFRDAIDFVRQVGVRRGRVRQGGLVDEDETARIILKDWNDGKIGYYTLPPTSQFCFGKSGGRNGDQEVSDEKTVLTTLSTGISMDVLPTFHLKGAEPMGARKRSKYYDEAPTEYGSEDQGDDHEVENDDDDDEVIEDTAVTRRRPFHNRRK
jgi:nuclear GTP-binding protein